jgi:hypothetical protein
MNKISNIISSNPESGFIVKVESHKPFDNNYVSFSITPYDASNFCRPIAGGSVSVSGVIEFSFNAGSVILDGTDGLRKLEYALREVLRKAEIELELQPNSL